jgi:hypothetical protein
MPYMVGLNKVYVCVRIIYVNFRADLWQMIFILGAHFASFLVLETGVDNGAFVARCEIRLTGFKKLFPWLFWVP